MLASNSVLSEALQSISITKIRELEKQKNAYAARKADILNSIDGQDKVVRDRISALLDGVKSTSDSQDSEMQKTLENIRRWLDQSIYDPSVPDTKLQAFETQLRSYLDRGSRRLDLAHLYSRLLTEWIGSAAGPDTMVKELEDASSDGGFEVVEDSHKARLEQLREKFAHTVFEPLETSEEKITHYLTKLFEGDDATKALDAVRMQLSSRGREMLSDTFRFTDESLELCIKSMLKNELLNEEKKASLNNFLKDDAVLSEIKDVLNMRFRDLADWNWSSDEDGMPVRPRQGLNGKWRVMMDEDVLDGLFTHWIGTHWAVAMRSALVDTRNSTGLWKQDSRLPDDEGAKLKYYIGYYPHYGETVVKKRQTIHQKTFFLSSLPEVAFEEAADYEDTDMPSDTIRKSPKDVKQLLLRTVATEVIMGRSLDGEVAVVQSDFKWFGTSIAHSTVFAVLRFLGVQEEWISFFKKFLEPPLDMLDGSPVRARKRGLPMAHIFDKVFGEMILFFMDLAVAQNDGMILYRFYDDLCLVGKPERCTRAWSAMEEFAKIMGLEFNKGKTGSVYLTDGKKEKDVAVAEALPKGPVIFDFLALDPTSGRWTIDRKHVQEHLIQLKKQLADCKGVLAWIKTWNSCIGRFFGYTFGEPANCLGRPHVDEILKTHRDIQNFLFNDRDAGTTAVEHIKHLISSRFNVCDIPDSFISMPEPLGGLGVKNPFIPLLLLRNNVCKDPEKEMTKFHGQEKHNYEQAKKEFESWNEGERHRRWRNAFCPYGDEATKPVIAWDDAQSFITFDEYTKLRELTSRELLDHYKYLLEEPKKLGISATERLEDGLEALSSAHDGLAGRDGDMEAELLWTVQFFEDELFENSGGLEIVDKSLVPSGVLKALGSKKVTWQMNL